MPAHDVRFLDVDMPPQFILEVRDAGGRWIDWGRFDRELFGRLDDGSYVCAGHGGSPLFLRCTEQRGNEIECVDGGGELHIYRLAPVDQGNQRQ